jgi:hypothetical protein
MRAPGCVLTPLTSTQRPLWRAAMRSAPASSVTTKRWFAPPP